MDWIDPLYDTFCDSLPAPLRPQARGLAHWLKLAPSPDIPWSQVFGQEVTIGIPSLLAQTMPALPFRTTVNASFAHLLAVVIAFAVDRLEDGQVVANAEALAVLSHARELCAQTLARLAPGVCDPRLDVFHAEALTRKAIGWEKTLLRSGDRVDFADYEIVSRGKQSLGLPASLALARAAGWSDRRIATLEKMLLGIWCGLQYHDDVVDWEQDLNAGGSWIVALALAIDARKPRSERATVPPFVRTVVFESGVLKRLLLRSCQRFRQVARRAELLGAQAILGWARLREDKMRFLALQEEKHAGYANRAHALAAFAREVVF